MAIPFPDIDPVAFHIGPLAIRWYALSYVAGIVLGWKYILFQIKRFPHQRPNVDDIENFANWAVMGILIGGRIGYVLFYNWNFYSQNLQEIFKIWNGGMSFHGGMLGMFLAVIFFAKNIKYHRLFLAIILLWLHRSDCSLDGWRTSLTENCTGVRRRFHGGLSFRVVAICRVTPASFMKPP